MIKPACTLWRHVGFAILELNKEQLILCSCENHHLQATITCKLFVKNRKIGLHLARPESVQSLACFDAIPSYVCIWMA